MLYLTRGFIRKSAEVIEDYVRYNGGRCGGGIVSAHILLSAVYIPIFLAIDLISFPVQVAGAVIAWSVNRSDAE